MPVRLKYGSGSSDYVEVKLSEVLKTIGFNKKVVPIPDGDQIVINLGKNGPDLTLKFSVRDTATYDKLANIVAGKRIQIQYGTGYTYKELPSGSWWWVDKIETKRNKGYVDQWDVTLYITAEGMLIYAHPW